MGTVSHLRIVEVDDDPYSEENLCHPYELFARLRSLGDCVWLTRYQVPVVVGYDACQHILKDHDSFISGSGVGPKNIRHEEPWRPPGLLQTDPPVHTAMRRAMASVISPRAARSLRADFDAYAEELLESLLDRDSVDAVTDLAQPFPLRVMGDAVGIPREGRRENLLPQGAMNFATFGPENDLYRHYFHLGEPTTEWVMKSCQPESLTEGGLGWQIWQCAERGEITRDQAGRLARATLTAGIDTTVFAIGNMIRALSAAPDQWDLIRADPRAVRFAVDEALRFDSPFQSFYRTTSTPVQVCGVDLEPEAKVMLHMGSANRDTHHWGQDADQFRVDRNAAGHLAFGMGIHQCVGQPIARMEMESVLTALTSRVASLEPTGDPVPFVHNTLRGFKSIPLRLIAA